MNAPLRQSTILVLFLAAVAPSIARAQLQTLPDPEAQRVFAGEGRKLTVLLHNAIADHGTHDVRVTGAGPTGPGDGYLGGPS